MTDEEEQALLRKIDAGLEAHKSHRQMWRLDPDGFHRCPECDPLGLWARMVRRPATALRKVREVLAIRYHTQWLLCRAGVHDWGVYQLANGDTWTRCWLCAKRPAARGGERR